MATTATQVNAVPRTGKPGRRLSLIPYLFILPHLIFFAIFIGYPFFNGIYISFLNFDYLRLEATRFVGVQNYIDLFTPGGPVYGIAPIGAIFSAGVTEQKAKLWSTYIGSAADVLDPRKKNPPAAQMFNDILDYPPWLQMGDQPGTFVSRCYGRKVFDFKSMPATWQALFTKKFPDVAADMAAVLRA